MSGDTFEEDGKKTLTRWARGCPSLSQLLIFLHRSTYFSIFSTHRHFSTYFCPTAEGVDEQLSHRYKIRRRIAPFTHIFAKSMKIVHRSYELHWRRRILFELSRQIKFASTNYKQTAVLFFSFQSVSIFLIFSIFYATFLLYS